MKHCLAVRVSEHVGCHNTTGRFSVPKQSCMESCKLASSVGLSSLLSLLPLYPLCLNSQPICLLPSCFFFIFFFPTQFAWISAERYDAMSVNPSGRHPLVPPQVSCLASQLSWSFGVRYDHIWMTGLVTVSWLDLTEEANPALSCLSR